MQGASYGDLIGLTKRFDSRSTRLAFGKSFIRRSRSGVERCEFIRERSSAGRRSDNHHPKAPASSGRRLQSREPPQLTRQGQGR